MLIHKCTCCLDRTCVGRDIIIYIWDFCLFELVETLSFAHQGEHWPLPRWVLLAFRTQKIIVCKTLLPRRMPPRDLGLVCLRHHRFGFSYPGRPHWPHTTNPMFGVPIIKMVGVGDLMYFNAFEMVGVGDLITCIEFLIVQFSLQLEFPACLQSLLLSSCW